jgi:hypothetical protein
MNSSRLIRLYSSGGKAGRALAYSPLQNRVEVLISDIGDSGALAKSGHSQPTARRAVSVAGDPV